jgi:hypothetical protein
MAVELDAGRTSQFPEVIWVDADRRGNVINLTFGTRIEGQGAGLRVSLTLPQWENLKFLVDDPKSVGPLSIPATVVFKTGQ